MKNFSKMLKDAQNMQSKMEQLQQRLESMEISGTSAAGLVVVRINGRGDMLGLSLDRTLINPEEKEILEDLVVAAFADAKSKMDALASEETQQLAAGFQLPADFKMPF